MGGSFTGTFYTTDTTPRCLDVNAESQLQISGLNQRGGRRLVGLDPQRRFVVPPTDAGQVINAVYLEGHVAIWVIFRHPAVHQARQVGQLPHLMQCQECMQ